MKGKTVVVPDQPSLIKKVFDPSQWFIFAHWGGRDNGLTPDERFVQVGVDEQGRKLWAGPLY
jgi:hypothetical protein